MKTASVVTLDRALIFLGFLLTALYGYGHFVDGDVVQILNKAHLFVTKGIFIPYGNLSSSGASGHNPGAFTTFITAMPMKVWFSPWSALVVLALLHFLALLMFQNTMKNFLSPLGMTFLIVVFWLNPWRMSEVFLWNPGYMYFASLLHMWSAFHLSKKRSFLFSFLHAQSVFLGLQIHPSFIILVFITFLLLWYRAMKPNWWGTAVGIIFGVLTLLPYILAGIEDPSILPRAGGGESKGFLFFGLVYIYPMLKGLWYWVLFGSNIFQTHVFHQLDFSWMGQPNAESFFKVLWTGIKYLVGAMGVSLSFYVNYQFIKKNKTKFNLRRFKMTDPREWLPLYAISAFFSAMIATAMAPTLPIYWHLLYVWPMALIPLLIKMDDFLREGTKTVLAKKYLLLLIVFFSTSNLLGALGSKKHNIFRSFHEIYFEICDENCELDKE